MTAFGRDKQTVSGKDITVEFDEPRTVQIDGETVFDVTKYNVKSYV